jgi:hypothetical protein
VYAAYATSDAVIEALLRRNLIEPRDIRDGALPIEASAVESSVGGGSTPLLTISAVAETPARATKLTIGATDTFIATLSARQRAAGIPPAQRVEVRVVKRTGEAELVEPRSKTTPIVIMLAGLTATFGAAFVRHNIRRTKEALETRGPASAEPGWEPHPAMAAASSDLEQDESDEEPEIPAVARSRWSASSG